MKLLAPGNDTHHLFTYHEIRAKLVELYGQPKTDEDHCWIQQEVRRIHRRMPTFFITREFHVEIHRQGK